MIYLFEDRKGRMDQYLHNDLDSKDIEIALLDCQKENLVEYLSDNFSNSKAIIFHSSYSFNDKNITNEDVKKYFSEKKIPFVYFSGGLNNNLVIENGITNGNVNSEDMYKNLIHFLKNYNLQQKINVPLLVYGQKYLLNSLLELQIMISLYLFDNPNNYILNIQDFNEIIDLVDARLKEDEVKEDKFKLLDWLNIESKKMKLDKLTLLSQIQKLNDKY
jgi:hypothetical protein